MLRPQRRQGREKGGKARPFSVKCGKFCLRAGETNHMKVALVAQIVHRNAHVQHDKLKLSGTHAPTHTQTHTRTQREILWGNACATHTVSWENLNRVRRRTDQNQPEEHDKCQRWEGEKARGVGGARSVKNATDNVQSAKLILQSVACSSSDSKWRQMRNSPKSHAVFAAAAAACNM